MEARQVGPTGLVIAVEPAPRNDALLCRNIAVKGHTQIVPIQFVEIHNTHFQDPLSVFGPWIEQLFSSGFRPQALAVERHKPSILWDPPTQNFAELLCRFRDTCPHVLFIKNG